MPAPTVPPVIPIPFATNNPTLRTDIPDTTTDPGQASWDQGFPADTMQPVVAGGVPPFGQNFNGLEFALSSHDYYIQAGATFPFQAAVAAAIGGYGVGAIIGSATDATIIWVNTLANNTTNPDATDGSAAGWASLFSYGFATPAAVTGAGTVTLSNSDASRRFIVLTGTLGGNQLVQLPQGMLQSWLIINNTTGAFTLTLKTTAGGSGVAVPQGGFSNPLGVYSDGTNIYPTVAPLGVPISQASDPLTLVERTNTGAIAVGSINSAIGVDNATIVNVYTDSGDGNIRKSAFGSNFEPSMNLANVGGVITPAQVPLSAVIQYVTNILASAALTGTPTTPTAAPGTADTQVASTAFAAGTAALAGSNGPGTQSSFTLPNGVTVKFGQTSAFTGTNFNVAFTNPFGTIGYVALVIGVNSSNDVFPTSAPSTAGFQIGGGSSGLTCLWIAVGK